MLHAVWNPRPPMPILPPMRIARALAVGLAYFVITLVLDGWGLPSTERAAYYPAHASVRQARAGLEGFYVTGPSKSFHPDEASILGALASMKPSQLDLNPHFFNYPTLHIYAVGAALAAAQKLHWLPAGRSAAYFAEHPEDAARLYRVGRAVSGLWAGLALGALAYVSTAGLIAAILLGCAPLFLVAGCSMTVDMAAAALATVALLAAAGLKSPKAGGVFWVGVLCGLAASAKYPAALALGPLLLVALGPGERRKGRLGLIGFALLGAALGFVAGTPYSVLTPGEFFHGVQAELLHSREAHGFQFMAAGPAWAYHLKHSLQSGCGFLFTLFLIGILGSLLDLSPRRRALLLYLALGAALLLTSHLYFARYWLPFLPAATLLASEGWALMLERTGALGERLGKLGTVALLGSQAALALAYAALMTVVPDTRLEAARDLAELPAGTRVQLYERPNFTTPPLDVERLKVRAGLFTAESLQAAPPDVIVASEFELRDLARQKAAAPGLAGVAQLLLGDARMATPGNLDQRIVATWRTGPRLGHPKIFAHPAGFGPWTRSTLDEPQELVMLHPTIYIWR
jgi:hypothetical protein